VWPDGAEIEVEAEKVKRARWRAVDRRLRDDGYVTSDDERRQLDVQAVRDHDHDACEVKQASDGGWWIVARPELVEPTEPTTLPCPHCQKPVVIRQTGHGVAPGRPFVLWEFKDRDDAEGLCTMVNVMILCAVMREVVKEDDDERVAAHA
jgi:hypothetical protein